MLRLARGISLRPAKLPGHPQAIPTLHALAGQQVSGEGVSPSSTPATHFRPASPNLARAPCPEP